MSLIYIGFTGKWAYEASDAHLSLDNHNKYVAGFIMECSEDWPIRLVNFHYNGANYPIFGMRSRHWFGKLLLKLANPPDTHPIDLLCLFNFPGKNGIVCAKQ